MIRPMSTMKVVVVALSLTLALAAWMAYSGKPLRLPDDPRDVPREAQLNRTESAADLNGDGVAETILVVNALTGDADPARGAEVLFAVAEKTTDGRRGKLLWVRRAMQETDRAAHDGDITAVDLDGDARSELIVTWDQSISPDRVERRTEIYTFPDLSRARRVWEGEWERDTRRDPQTPEIQREWFRREIDFGATRRQGGQGLALRKIVNVDGGARIDPPRVTPEWVTVVLRSAPSR